MFRSIYSAILNYQRILLGYLLDSLFLSSPSLGNDSKAESLSPRERAVSCLTLN